MREKYSGFFWDDGNGGQRRKYWDSFWDEEKREILSLFPRWVEGKEKREIFSFFPKWVEGNKKGEILNLFLRWPNARIDLLVIELLIRHRSVGQVWGTFDGEDHWIKLLSLLLGHEWGVQLQLYKHVLYSRDRRLQPIGDRLHSYKLKKDFIGLFT